MGMSSAPQRRRFLVECGESQIEAFVVGDGDSTLILAAGNGRPGAQLDRLASDLAADGIRCVTFNYRGIGDSSGPHEGITLHDYANDMLAIADHLGVWQVHLAGKTFGNRVVRAAAHRVPERVASTTLIGAGGKILPSAETQALYRRLLDPSISPAEWSALNTELNYAPVNAHCAASALDLGMYPEVSAAQIAASDATPPEEWMPGGRGPMLVIVGLDDRVAVPANGFEIATTRPHTTLIGLADCGHNMVDEQPERLRRAIAEFVHEHST